MLLNKISITAIILTIILSYASLFSQELKDFSIIKLDNPSIDSLVSVYSHIDSSHSDSILQYYFMRVAEPLKYHLIIHT